MRILAAILISALLAPLAQAQVLDVQEATFPGAVEPGSSAAFQVDLVFLCPNPFYANPGGWVVQLQDPVAPEGVTITAAKEHPVPQEACIGDGRHEVTSEGEVQLDEDIARGILFPVRLVYQFVAEGDLPTANDGEMEVFFNVHAPANATTEPTQQEAPEQKSPGPALPLLALVALAAAAVRRRE